MSVNLNEAASHVAQLVEKVTEPDLDFDMFDLPAGPAEFAEAVATELDRRGKVDLLVAAHALSFLGEAVQEAWEAREKPV